MRIAIAILGSEQTEGLRGGKSSIEEAKERSWLLYSALEPDERAEAGTLVLNLVG